jgi:accessory gene regulator protein AgrB
MILWRVTLDQLQPSISSLSQFSFAQYFFHIIHIINKAWYLGAILQKLVIMKAAPKKFN